MLLKPLILPNTPTPKPTSPSPTPGCSRQLQVRVAAAETIERPVELEVKAEVVCLGVVGGEEALDAPCAPPRPSPPPVGLGQHRRPGLRPAPRSSPAPAARQAARRGVPTWPGPAIAATSRHPAPGLRLLPAALPPHSLTPGRPASARQGLALLRGQGTGNLKPGLKSSEEPGAEPGKEWRAPPSQARGHPQRWGP